MKYDPKLKPQVLTYGKRYGLGRTNLWEKLMLLRTLEIATEGYTSGERFSIDNPVFVEIGTSWGLTLQSMCLALQDLGVPSTYVSIDILRDRRVKAMMPGLRKQLSTVRVTLLNGESWKMVDKVPRPIVWCFVDGCHCKDCVAKDIKAYAPLVEVGGFLIFHEASSAYKEMEPCQWYHGEKANRPVGVLDAIEAAEGNLLSSYELLEEAPARPLHDRSRSRRRCWYGGMRVYQRREE